MSSHKDIQNQYLNVRIANESVVPYTAAVYNKTNTNPILYQPNLYKLSIDRFQIPVDTIPLIIADPTIPGGNELVYELYMTNDNWTTTSTKNLEYVNNNLSITSSDERYYYVYTYSRFIQFLNAALFDLYVNQLGGTANPPPHFEFDSTTQKFSLVCPDSEFGDLGTWGIRFNFPLLRYFGGFQLTTINQGVLYEFEIYNKFNNIVDIGGNDYLIMIPDYNTLSRWNALQNIIITTSLPVNQQFVETGNQAGATTSSPILTDFIVIYPDGNSYAATTVELTTDERSYYDLYGTSPIRNISLQVFWTDYKGTQYPLYLSKETSISIKLLFTVRRDI